MVRDTIKNENAGLPIVTGIRELGGRTARKRPRSWKNLSYVTRMTLSFAAVAAMTTLLAIVVLSIVWNEHFASYTRENMFATARATAAGIAREYERVGGGWTTEVLAPAVNAAANNAGVGVAVIDAQGVTRYDSSLVFEESDGFGIGQSLQPTSVSQIATASIFVDGQVVGTVRVWVYGSESMMRQTDQQFRNNSYQAMGLAAIVAIVIASVIGYLFAHRLVRPINRMTETAREIEAGDLAARTGLRGSDEISQLGETFDDMAESVQKSIINERRLTTDVAHELRSPLQALQMNVEAMIDGVYPKDDAHLIPINDEVTRLARMVSDLLELSRLESGSMVMKDEVVDVGKMVSELMSRYDLLFEDYKLHSVVECADGVFIKGDAGKLSQAVTNLIANAIRYTDEGGTITVKVTSGDIMANIMVADTGIGLTPEEAKQVFDRFWRADDSRSRDSGGLGIGLSLVKEIVQRHGGWVQVDGRKGEGATFTIHLPLYHDRAQKTTEVSAARTAKAKGTKPSKSGKTGKFAKASAAAPKGAGAKAKASGVTPAKGSDSKASK